MTTEWIHKLTLVQPSEFRIFIIDAKTINWTQLCLIFRIDHNKAEKENKKVSTLMPSYWIGVIVLLY